MENDLKFADYLNESLTEEEKLKIEKVFCADSVLYEAVRKVLLQSIYISGTIQKGFDVDPMINGAFALASLSISNPIPDAEIGAHLRGQWAGVNYLKNGFDSLQTIKSKTVEEVTPAVNEAV